MAIVDDEDPHEAYLGEVPDGIGAELYPDHLERLRGDEDFGEAVLSFPDAEGHDQEISIDDVESTERDAGSDRTKIRMRNGVIVVATGAVIATAIAAVRYRRKHKQ